MSRFQEALLDELVTHARENAPPAAVRAPRRRRRWWAAAAGATAAAVAALLIGPLTGTPAYAVVTNEDGSVSIRFRELADPEAATRDLVEAGLPARVVRLSDPGTCPAPASSGRPWQWDRPLPADHMGVFSPSTEFPDDLDYLREVHHDGVTFVPDAVPAEAMVFIIEYPVDTGGFVVGFGLVRRPGPTCWEADPNLP